MISNTNELTIPNLKVATLNIWGIRFISKDVQVRINHLIDALNQSDFDLVALQEVQALRQIHQVSYDV
jgi:endonuclease/exonuclease/phosphatase family metal-dependent hydrolase